MESENKKDFAILLVTYINDMYETLKELNIAELNKKIEAIKKGSNISDIENTIEFRIAIIKSDALKLIENKILPKNFEIFRDALSSIQDAICGLNDYDFSEENEISLSVVLYCLISCYNYILIREKEQIKSFQKHKVKNLLKYLEEHNLVKVVENEINCFLFTIHEKMKESYDLDDLDDLIFIILCNAISIDFEKGKNIYPTLDKKRKKRRKRKNKKTSKNNKSIKDNESIINEKDNLKETEKKEDNSTNNNLSGKPKDIANEHKKEEFPINIEKSMKNKISTADGEKFLEKNINIKKQSHHIINNEKEKENIINKIVQSSENNIIDLSSKALLNIEQDSEKIMSLIESKDIPENIRGILKIMNDKIENQNKVIENQNKVIENQNKVIENQKKEITNLKEKIMNIEEKYYDVYDNLKLLYNYFNLIMNGRDLNKSISVKIEK